MLKRYCILLLAVLSAGFIVTLVWMGSLSQAYCMGAEVCSSETIAEKIAGKKQIAAVSGTITFNDHRSYYDIGTNTIFISQDAGSDEFQGRLETSDGVLYLEKDALLSDKKTAIRESKKFALYQVMDGQFCKYDLLFTGVPVMALSVNDSYQKEINFRDNTVWIADVSIEDPYSKKLYYQETQAEFYVRGEGSFYEDYGKRNYKLNLKGEKLSILGMRKDDDWLLNGLCDDAGLIHNKLSYKLWNQLSAYNEDPKTFTTNMEYADLFIDDEYMGLFGIMERIDRKELKLAEGDILYKCRSDRIPEEHNFTNEMTDGLRPIFIVKYPKEPTEEDWEPLRQWVDYFQHGLAPSAEAASRLIDYRNAIDYNLYCLLICGSDNMCKNSYLIADRQSDGEYVIKHIPWDLNATWGNPWVNVPEANFTVYDPETITDTYTWCPEIILLYNEDEQRVARDMFARWNELRETIYAKENIYRILDEQFAYLYDTGAYGHNYEWYENGTEYWRDEYLYQYVEGRLAFLDMYFDKLYRASTGEAVYVYNDVDYTAEFRPRFYWERNAEVLHELFEEYDEEALLEHYALYGKPYGLVAKQK